MKLSTKHPEVQQVVIRADFSGGLNTASGVEDISETQLAECINLEVNAATGRLETVAGTTDILAAPDIFAVVYDSINSLMLVVKSDKQIYLADFESNINSSSIGKLAGELYPKYIAWENGVLIASGGKLQYFNGAELVTIEAAADDVFVRKGRVLITSGSTIRYSGVGDELDWGDDNNRENSSKFVEVGYKDGANFIGIVPLSQDILIIKDNGKSYRLTGEFPEWQASEVAENVECSGRRSFCAVGDDVFVLGENEAQMIQNAYYGNVKPENIALQIKSEICKLPKNAQVRFVAPLWQVWLIGDDGFVLVYDIRFKAWFKRRFNAGVIDVFSVNDDVYVVKADRISKLDAETFKDNGEYLSWKFIAQRMVSHHDFLLKRTKVTVTPLNHEFYSGQISCGRVVIPLPIPDRAMKVFEDNSPIYKDKTKIARKGRVRGRIFVQPKREADKLFAGSTFEIESQNVFRCHYLDVQGRGNGGRFILHSIVMDIAEV